MRLFATRVTKFKLVVIVSVTNMVVIIVHWSSTPSTRRQSTCQLPSNSTISDTPLLCIFTTLSSDKRKFTVIPYI